MNDENLVSMADRPPRERSEIGRKGAIASNKVQKEKRMMREVVQTLMKTELNAGTVAKLKKQLPFLETGMDIQTAMVLGQMKAAIDGNSKAFELLTVLNDSTAGKQSNEYEQELSIEELRGLLNESKQSDDSKD